MHQLYSCLADIGPLPIIIAIGSFFLAFLLHWILFACLNRLLASDGFYRPLVSALRYPILAIFFEVAAIFSINLLGLREKFETLTEQAISIMVIGTMGWLFAALAKALYGYYIYRYEHDTKKASRAALTQVQFLYRLIMFAILGVTLGLVLMTFPAIKSLGVGLLGSAGILGLALGIAARPILLNVMAGFLLTFTKNIKIGDGLLLEGEFCRVTSIHITYVEATTWDEKKVFVPTSFFFDKPFKNWESKEDDAIHMVFLYCDYTAPVEVIRQKALEIIDLHSRWSKINCKVHVTNATEKTIQVRISLPASNPSESFEVKAFMREKLIEFLQKEYPSTLPRSRVVNIEDDKGAKNFQ